MQVQIYPLPIRCPENTCNFKRYILPGATAEDIELLLADHNNAECLELWLEREEEDDE